MTDQQSQSSSQTCDRTGVEQTQPSSSSRYTAYPWQATLLILGVVIGIGLGTRDWTSQAIAQPAKPAAAAVVPPMGVSIPANGAALVKGTDGNAYVVSNTGVAIRVSRAGKPLELP